MPRRWTRYGLEDARAIAPGKLALIYEDLGDQTVKNIAKPVRVFRISTEPATSAILLPAAGVPRRAAKFVRPGALSLAAVAIIAGAVVLVQHLSVRLPTRSASVEPSVTNAISGVPAKPFSANEKEELLSLDYPSDMLHRV